ncbi:hypothetical protein [Pseudobacteroides cellulosolvens]|uniref:Uncharacterized protein n=1 Tax=Pseudobacteroides cellulosolvens ATCC 35603 = DSM 2933 TaxID=398512 RepID=A0A0L6JVS0_9FIRM|nr:hypothetical protein [Pseudobacteroides cellulosolvens]KNY29814.1 hypothetical protein Bccel_5091 [Pseudobacteroides cellulosolvens ATCC 35603 = DSM 2933]
MKKIFIALLLLTALSFLSTLLPLNNTKNIEKPLTGQQPNNKVVTSTWPWLPMMQFDKYRSLFDMNGETSGKIIKSTSNGINIGIKVP